ncbi:family 78 glycoside hydrolase catalytic domain [Tunicatimonas pelagia]|uniref:family 78 glycoside hydrolase catalytic domain n=1 Tax=Tunicatimonas pelagia TaxID=931531 RepID=UPI002665ED5A|nr:family 78 glycoside hydrolase catalytic domain [Tunicatimonas pelagia]WKN41179.1 family 78 glycoside hydrolase catalytic domain [Tunicatimonas pelagia]
MIKSILLLGFFVVFAAQPFLSFGQSTQNATSPNIIFILTDDQRWDALGYAGNELIHTPEMDKLAKQGTYFSHAMVTTPICAGSRASILSGLYERTHRYNFQSGPMQEHYMQQAYPRLLKEAGYRTGFYGKFGVNYPDLNALFDEYESYDRNNKFKDRRGYYYKALGEDTVHLTRYTGQQALDFIDRADSRTPFCLSLSFSAPHAHDPAEDQYFWQSESDKLLAKTEMPEPNLGNDRYFNELPEPVREGFNRTRWHWRYDTPEKYQHSVKGYYRMISDIDREIAKIRQQLKKKKLDKNTVIILMGDNGYFLGERQLAGKWLLYDNSVRVPLIVFDPRVDKHQSSDELALNVDVPATMLALAGVNVPDTYQGKSLLPIVSGETTGLARDTALIEHLWEFEYIPPSEGVRTKQWKYFRYVNDKSSEELYHLTDDPQETNNLAKDPNYQDVLADLSSATDRLIREHSDSLSIAPHGLMVEFIRPSGTSTVNDQLPEYSWTVPQGAVRQQGYQLLVASSEENLAENIGDVWNSGQVKASISANVEHGGNPLAPQTKYFWKVRIWDEGNRVTDYSEAHSFQTTNFQSGNAPGRSFQLERIHPTVLEKTSENSYFADFGKHAFGKLKLRYQAPAATTLTVRLGEKLKDGQIDREPGGTLRYQEVRAPVSPDQQTYEIELERNERNTLPVAVALPDSFGIVMPFRYAEIEGVQTELKPDDLTQLAYFNYWNENESSFTSSDTLLNQVWDLCKYTMKATSFAGIYVDGDRERIPYEADAYINQLGHYTTDREYAMAQRTIEWFMNNPTWPTEWLLHTALMMYQDYYYSGNTELIEKYYEPLKSKTLIDLAREDGLISSTSGQVTGPYMAQLGFADTTNRLKDIVDWPPAQKDTGWKLSTEEGERDGHQMLPINTVVNSFFYQNMKMMAELAEVLGKSEDASHFALMAAKVKQTINTKLLDKEQGIYLDGEGATHSSLHSNMMPLAFGLVPPEHQKTVVEFIKSRGMACSVYGAQFLLEGLYEAGASDYALELMTATHDRSWWNMIAAGSTVALEAWDMKYKPNLDWNHAWGATPANIIPRYLWGIQPKTPGFGIISIEPQMSKLKHSSIKMPTIKGSITGEYQFVNNRLQRYTIELPGNTVAEFTLPNISDAAISLNGQAVNPLFGSIHLEPGVNQIEIQINSF